MTWDKVYRGKTLLFLLKKYMPHSLEWERITIYQHEKPIFSGWVVFDEDSDIAVTKGYKGSNVDEEKTFTLSSLLDRTIDRAMGTKHIYIN